MNTIFAAMLKEHPELRSPVILVDPHKKSSDPAKDFITSAFTPYLGTAAVCAVLNGGYDAPPARVEPPAPATPRPAADTARRLRQTGAWLALLAVSGLIGVGFGHHSAPRPLAPSATHLAPAPKPVVAARTMPAVGRPLAKAPVQPGASKPRPASDALASIRAGSGPAGTSGKNPSPQLAQSAPPKPAVPIQVAQSVPPAKSPLRLTLVPMLKPKLIPDEASATNASAAKAIQVVKAVTASAPAPLQVADNRPAPALAGAPPLAGAAEVLYEGEPGPGVKLTAQVRAADGADGDAPAPAKKSARSSSTALRERGEPAPGASLRVEGIFWDRTRPMALVGGNIVEPGTHVGSIQVVEIREDGVVIDDGGQRRMLHP